MKRTREVDLFQFIDYGYRQSLYRTMLVRVDKQNDQAKCEYRTVSVRIDRRNSQRQGVETATDHYPDKVMNRAPREEPLTRPADE